MKRYDILTAVAVVASAFLTSACLQQELEGPQAKVVPSGDVAFTAEIEAPLTKTVLSGSDATGYEVVWQDGDEITVKDAAGKIGTFTTTDSGSGNANFTLATGYEGKTAPYQAWYPSTFYNDGSPELPDTQHYLAGNVANPPMYAKSSTTNLLFKNIGGIIRLNLSTELADQRISRITLSADQGLSGAITNAATLADDGFIAAVAAGGNLSLDCGGSGVLLSSASTPFYFYVPANTYTGLTITAITVTGVRQTWTLKEGKNVAVGRSLITDVTLSFTEEVVHTNLSAKGTANTYIVSEAGSYKFKATVKGNGGLDPLTGTDATEIAKADISGVTVLWELAECGKAIRYADGAYDVGYYDGYVYFNTPETFAAGDAYVAVYKDGTGGTAGVYDKEYDEVLWSWLIWATDAPESVDYGSLVVMDRNLGALGVGAVTYRGFAYEWGRKDPFPGSSNASYTPSGYYPARMTAYSIVNFDEEGMSVAYSIAHPTTYPYGWSQHYWQKADEYTTGMWWSGQKTIYDPCPVGWKVPSKDEMDHVRQSSASLPGAGFLGNCRSDFEYGNPGSCYYWTSTGVDRDHAWAWYGGTSFSADHTDNYTRSGYTIRPVEDVDARNIDDYTDLSAVASANSYIVPAAGNYKFQATVKGNGAANLAGITAATSAETIADAALVWASYGTSTAPAEGELIRRIGYKDNYVYFSTGNEYREGNAVVAIRDIDGNILWSWHLWFTDDDLEASVQTYPIGAVFMDRNLGALSADTAPSNYGLLYQWGRKDPFLNTYATFDFSNQNGTNYVPKVLGTAETRVQIDATTYTLAETIATPTKFVFNNPYRLNAYYSSEWACDMTDELWGEEKTIFDPCPPGYRVPSSWQWRGGFMEAFQEARPRDAEALTLTLGGNTYSFPDGAFRIRTSLSWSTDTQTYYRCYGRGAVEKPIYFQAHLWSEDGLLANTEYNGCSDRELNGFRYWDELSSTDKYGNYWPDNYCAGFNVRCVKESSIRVRPTGFALNKTELTLAEEETFQLTASFVPADVTVTISSWSSTDDTVASVDENGLVTAWKPGECDIVITAFDNGVTGSCHITVTETALAIVDLGLPSGTKWANINMGAGFTAGTGDFYAWGETATKETFSGSNYIFGNVLSPSKYTYDTIVTLEDADDAAYVNLGTRWHIPSPDDWVELRSNCNASSVEKGAVSGTLFTSKANGAQIFIPDGSYWTNSLSYAPAYGRYKTEYAAEYEFGIYYPTNGAEYSKYRDQGLSIRPVYR